MARASNRVSKITTITKVQEPTNILRMNNGILEQVFKDIETGETEWVKVPEVKEV